jgi:hypothetical protein
MNSFFINVKKRGNMIPRYQPSQQPVQNQDAVHYLSKNQKENGDRSSFHKQIFGFSDSEDEIPYAYDKSSFTASKEDIHHEKYEEECNVTDSLKARIEGLSLARQKYPEFFPDQYYPLSFDWKAHLEKSLQAKYATDKSSSTASMEDTHSVKYIKSDYVTDSLQNRIEGFRQARQKYPELFPDDYYPMSFDWKAHVEKSQEAHKNNS